MKRKKLQTDIQDEMEKMKEKKIMGSVEANGGNGVSWIRGKLIGKGSFGSVYMATLKKPRSKNGCFPSIMAVKSAEVSVSGTIQKEREALINIELSPYIIRCYGDEITTGENGQMVYNLLLECCSAGTLADLIKKSDGKGLPLSDVKLYTRSMLRGLSKIHDRGYVHCDLKPANILLLPNPSNGLNKFRVKIGDFGLAKRMKPYWKKGKCDSDHWRGTPIYMSPEATIDGIQEAPCDIWALGCIVLEMLTGKQQQHPLNDDKVKIPEDLSKDGKDFLKGCFVRNTKFRLTAEMLLNHSFMDGLVEDEVDGEEEEDEEDERILPRDLITSSLLLFEGGEDDDSDLVCSSFEENGLLLDGEFSCSSSWYEDVDDDDNVDEFLGGKDCGGIQRAGVPIV
ncbi:mitogen-activated protein kinase kinase kinase 20-like [Impatiens glandulifera]|uniref:mitogen-activated protein kinase kinase kinase 20-like n=1 Tax=Impatiens glandulifera TaxID=253017 RepID=UPI001FB191ED|nr:mitogen-activated protein kinase kinase kinase 20-like [Impatiens glandulifera]